jgi:hypothetical protein
MFLTIIVLARQPINHAAEPREQQLILNLVTLTTRTAPRRIIAMLREPLKMAK